MLFPPPFPPLFLALVIVTYLPNCPVRVSGYEFLRLSDVGPVCVPPARFPVSVRTWVPRWQSTQLCSPCWGLLQLEKLTELIR